MIKSNTIPVAARSLDLCNGNSLTLQAFAVALIEAAVRDFDAGRKAGRSGQELCDHLCEAYRKGHVRMASSIYSNAKWSLQTAAKESAA